MDGTLRVHSEVEGSGSNRVARERARSRAVSVVTRDAAAGASGHWRENGRSEGGGWGVWAPRRRVVVKDGAFQRSVKSEGWYNYYCCSPVALLS